MQSIPRPNSASNTPTLPQKNLESLRDGLSTSPPASAAQRAEGGVGEADALKLDTRILKGIEYTSPRPKHVPYSDKQAYSGRSINYPVYVEPFHFRLKVQEFTAGGFEATISSVNMQRFSDLASLGLKRGARTERKGGQESIDKARQRAKRTVRLKCKEMGADHLLTLTTRATISRDQLQASFARLTDLISYHFKRKFEYVCVCEPHPSNPEHLHLHCAIRGRMTEREMVIVRRCWYVALGGTGKERGPAAPGGFNIRKISAAAGSLRRVDKIASYISKYITKDKTDLFNKRRYWASKIDLVGVRAYWLKARTISDALNECLGLLDFVPDFKQDFFQARNIDLIWMRSVPDGAVDDARIPF